MKGLGFLTWIAISALLSALVQSWTMQCIWRWFISHEYGHGPSLGAWFGIATMAGFVVRMNTPKQEDDDYKDFDELIKESILKSIGSWVGCLILLAIVWCIGAVTGWAG